MTKLDPLQEPERIAFAGDWHMNGHWAVRAVHYARVNGADVIVQLGDFGYTYDPWFLDMVQDELEHQNLPLLFIDGNHEDFPVLYQYPIGDNGLRQLRGNIFHMPRGFRWEWAGTRFLAVGGAHSVDRQWREEGKSWWPEETITPDEAASIAASGPTDVLISHDCPSGVAIPGTEDPWPRPWPWPIEELVLAQAHREDRIGLIARSTQPIVIYHGHYHRRYEQRTDIGYGPIRVMGLDGDGTHEMGLNVAIVSLELPW